MTTQDMRSHLYTAYPDSPGWKEKVDGWPEKQVQAVYFRMLESGQLHRKRRGPDCVQTSMFDRYGRIKEEYR